MAHVPKVAMRSEVARNLRRVFDADEPAEAERRLKAIVARYQKKASQLAAWLEQAAPEAITVLMITLAHRRRVGTTNGLKRLNKEIKRRSRVATLFPNEASLLRLASAVLSEISDDWEIERTYLNIEA
jgi:putative transposase